MPRRPPKGVRRGTLQDEPSGVFNHEKPQEQMVDEIMGMLDVNYTATNGVDDASRIESLYYTMWHYMNGAFRPTPEKENLWVELYDPGTDTMNNFILSRRFYASLKLSLENNEALDELQKRRYIAALNRNLDEIEAGIIHLRFLGDRDKRIDGHNERPCSMPTRPKGRRPEKEPGGPHNPLESKATLQIIDRMISIICAREH